MEVLQWGLENWVYILEGISLLVAFATLVTRLTPTKEDDKLLGKVQAFLRKFSLLPPKTGEDNVE